MNWLLAFSMVCMSASPLVAAPSAPPNAALPKAYVVLEIKVTNPAHYERYKAAIEPLIAKYGGRYLVRAGRTEAVEGTPVEGRSVLLEFPSFEQAMKFERAPETLAASEIRHDSAKSRIYVVEGVTP